MLSVLDLVRRLDAGEIKPRAVVELCAEAIAARNLGLLLFDVSPTAKRALSRLSWGFGGALPRLSRGLQLHS